MTDRGLKDSYEFQSSDISQTVYLNQNGKVRAIFITLMAF